MRPLSLASDNASRPFSLWPKIRIPSENCLLTADFCFNFAAAVEADFLPLPQFSPNDTLKPQKQRIQREQSC